MEPTQMVYKGTTTVGVVCKDGVILASDTRVTMGYFVAHKKGKKIYKIDDHLAMTIAGGLADAQRTVDILKVNANLYKINMRREMPVSAAARLVANVLFEARQYPLLTQILIGGRDHEGYSIYSLDPFGSVTKEDCVATGSGSPIAYGVLEDRYRPDKTIKELLPVVVKAVDSAMKRDAASGDSFDVVIINDEGYRELSDEEKKRILEDSR